MLYSNEINIYSGASTYSSMSTASPLFGINVINRFGNYYIQSNSRIGISNQNNKGSTIESIYFGKIFYLNKYMSISPYLGYQHLWYGSLYNNGIGGGVKYKMSYNNFFTSIYIAGLYGFSGSVGYRSQHPGNVFIFYGSLGYNINPQLSVYVYTTQERYVNVGSYGSNSLTCQGSGLGFKYSF